MKTQCLNRRQILALTLAGSAPALQAQTSGRPVNFIVPQPAGNPTDGMARKIQPILQKVLGQPVLVENLPGAGGSIGLAKTLAAPPGTALMIAGQTEPILTPLALSAARHKPEDFRCVGMLSLCPYVLIGRPDLPARSYEELLALSLRTGAAPLSYAHIGPGSMIHLLGMKWSQLSKAPLNHVPYKGVPPVLQDLMGSQVDLSFLPLAGSLPSVLESGKVRIYGSTAASPSARMASLPLLSKLNPSLNNFVYSAWGAVFVPNTAPSEFTKQVHRAVIDSLEDPEFQAYLAGTGQDRGQPRALAQLDEWYRGEVALYQKMARDIGIERQ
jgi:tripartite-type tricarboxylate transporter receptor subunit TctC